MKYTPEKYEFDVGDVVCALDYYLVIQRVGHDKWINSRETTGRWHTDENIENALKNGSFKYLGNRFSTREPDNA